MAQDKEVYFIDESTGEAQAKPHKFTDVPEKKDLVNEGQTDASKELYHGVNLFTRSEFLSGIFDYRYRYGILNPYYNLSTAREILFFTKPDLNIFKVGTEDADSYGTDYENMNINLANQPLFVEIYRRFPQVLYSLQQSASGDSSNPFNNLLGNMVQSNLDVPDTTADMIETPSNVYGVSYKYRGSSESGDDNHTFSLEFKDTKFLPVYHFFKAYDVYEILKHHGAIRPRSRYISNKVLHDQYAIYKFVVDEDMETIIYYAKYYGVKSVNLPRNVFNNTNFDNGISYSIDFDAAFVEDMNPQILIDFNNLAFNYWESLSKDIHVFDLENGKVDMRAAKAAVVGAEIAGSKGFTVLGTNSSYNPQNTTENHSFNNIPGRILYKLKWRGDQSV